MRKDMGLYRGKRKDNGEWVEGYLTKNFFVHKEYWCIERIEARAIYAHATEYGIKSYEVIPETVGEYTGLPDKNGKKIFEGDIVKHYNNSDKGFDIGVLYWDETFSQWKRTSIGNFHHSSFTYSISRSCEYEVIGNIHDNPELLPNTANC